MKRQHVFHTIILSSALFTTWSYLHLVQITKKRKQNWGGSTLLKSKTAFSWLWCLHQCNCLYLSLDLKYEFHWNFFKEAARMEVWINCGLMKSRINKWKVSEKAEHFHAVSNWQGLFCFLLAKEKRKRKGGGGGESRSCPLASFTSWQPVVRYHSRQHAACNSPGNLSK